MVRYRSHPQTKNACNYLFLIAKTKHPKQRQALNTAISRHRARPSTDEKVHNFMFLLVISLYLMVVTA